MQQRLGRDAADVEADAAQGLAGVHQHDGLSEVGGAEGRGVAARPGAQDQDLAGDVVDAGRRAAGGLRRHERRDGRGTGARSGIDAARGAVAGLVVGRAGRLGRGPPGVGCVVCSPPSGS